MMLTSSLIIAGHLALTEQNRAAAETKVDEPCQTQGGILVVYTSRNPLKNSALDRETPFLPTIPKYKQ
jgi:hypothetical protein